jgi:hypothetical protein
MGREIGPAGKPVVERLDLFAIAGLTGTAFFVLAVVSLHFLRPDYDPAVRTMSEFAIGPYGYLMTIALFALGFGSLALAFGIRRSVIPSTSLQAASILLGVWGVGMVLDGIFPSDLGGAAVTSTGAVHSAAAFAAFIGLIAAAFLFPRALKGDPRWQPFQRQSRILAYVIVVGFFASFATFGLGQGVGNRIFASVVIAWLLITSARLRLVAKAGSQQEMIPRVPA